MNYGDLLIGCYNRLLGIGAVDWVICAWCFWCLAFKLLDQGPYGGEHLGMPDGKSNVEGLGMLGYEYPYAVLGIEGITLFLYRLIPLNRVYFGTLHDTNSCHVRRVVGRNR
jgi:hypothetical protein